jgi:hypothetical protein
MTKLNAFLAIFLIASLPAEAGLPPTTIKGQADSTKPTTFDLQVKGFQSTRTGGTSALIETGYNNLIANPSFEASTVTSGWTVSNGTPSADTTNQVDGLKALSMSLSSVNGDVVSQSVTPSQVLTGQNLEHGCMVRTSQTSVQVCGLQGSVEIGCASVPSNNVWSYVPVNSVGPNSGSIGVKIKTTSSTTGTVLVDDCYVGRARNISQVSQAQFVGSAVYPNTAGCIWTTSSTIFAAFGAASGCPAPTVTGLASAVDADLPQITFSSLPPGEYMVIASGTGEGSAGTYYGYTISDGTSQRGNYVIRQSNAGTPERAGFTTVGFFSYSTAGARTFRLFGFNGSGSTTTLYNNQLGQNQTEFKVYRFPTTSELAVRTDQLPASWSGYHSGATWSTTSASFIDPTVSGTPVINERTNRNFGTVSTASSNRPGITFTPSRAGRIMVIAAVQLKQSTPAKTAQLQLTDGTNTLGHAQISTNGGTGSFVATQTVVGVLNATAATSYTVTIQLATDSSSTASIDNASGQSITWTLVSLDQSFPAPVLVGSVTSNSAGVERVERATVSGSSGSDTTTCASSPCSIRRQSGFWLSSVTRNSVGDYTLNIASGIFSDIPDCALLSRNSDTVYCSPGANTLTSTAYRFACRTVSGTPTLLDTSFSVICMGPR